VCSFSPTDTRCVTGGDDSAVRLWSLGSGGAVQEAEMIRHGGQVASLEWHPTLSLIASGSRDATVKLWDPSAGPEELASL
jgi:polyadenylation factor subunit 2